VISIKPGAAEPPVVPVLPSAVLFLLSGFSFSYFSLPYNRLNFMKDIAAPVLTGSSSKTDFFMRSSGGGIKLSPNE